MYVRTISNIQPCILRSLLRLNVNMFPSHFHRLSNGRRDLNRGRAFAGTAIAAEAALARKWGTATDGDGGVADLNGVLKSDGCGSETHE